MDDDVGSAMRHWGGYFGQPGLKSNLGLQLMPSLVERDTKNLLSNGGIFYRDYGLREAPPLPMEYIQDGSWLHQGQGHGTNSKALHLPVSHNHHNHMPINQNVLPDPPAAHAHTLQMLQLPEQPQHHDENALIDEPIAGNEVSLKKRRSPKSTQKLKKPKKATASPADESGNGKAPRAKAVIKSTSIVINGINMDISGIPTPVCTCTGNAQQCYRWGVGGWQSACCTTSLSMYPLPMSNKRRGARIAGRKMSQGAFAKVLEKLAGEGYNLSNPIDLKPYWAKHGTNKFVTIR